MRARPERLWLDEPVSRLGALVSAQVRTAGPGSSRTPCAAATDIPCARRGAPGGRADHGACNAGQYNYKNNKKLGRLTVAIAGAVGCLPLTEALCGSTIRSHRGPTGRRSLSRWCGTWAWPR